MNIPLAVRRTVWTSAAALALTLPSGEPLRGADEPKKELRFVALAGDLPTGKPMNWMGAWNTDQNGTLVGAGEAALRVARGMDRTALKEELDHPAESRGPHKSARVNLDVGRHNVVKHLVNRAIIAANERLTIEKLEPLREIRVLNCGGYGDFSRDLDLTAYGEDDLRERYFVDALRSEARKLELEVLPKTGGSDHLTIPQLEISIHRGKNDLPDPTFGNTVHFAVDCRRAVEEQIRNPEAYFGYGFDIEQNGRKSNAFKPTQTMLQTFECDDGKTVRFRADPAVRPRELVSVLRGTADRRYRRSQHAVHVMNHFFQASMHAHGKGDASQGPIKYAGRAVDDLCSYAGLPPWNRLAPADRLEVIKTVMPRGLWDRPDPSPLMDELVKTLDVAWKTYHKVEGGLREGTRMVDLGADRSTALTLAFLRKATAATAHQVVLDMIHPPPFDERLTRSPGWAQLDDAERRAKAMHGDENYRKCLSLEARENLLGMMIRLKMLDHPDFNPHGGESGAYVIRGILDESDPHIRPFLELADIYAEGWIQRERATDNRVRRAAGELLIAVRAKMDALLKRKSPGSKLTDDLGPLGPDGFVRADKGGRLPPEVDALRRRRAEFAPLIKAQLDIKALQEKLAPGRWDAAKAYLAQRVMEELLDPGNISDALQMIEMHQKGASAHEFGEYLLVNLLSRCHWSVGFFISAGQVRYWGDVRDLGQNLFFVIMAQQIPGVAVLRLAFDIQRGLATVTVGWAMSEADRLLIDALYTGAAGRSGEGAAGTVGGRLRDSGFSVLAPQFVPALADKKGKPVPTVDSAAIYVDRFRAWTGVGHDQARLPTTGDVGAMVIAHDALARMMNELAAKDEAAWFGGKRGVFNEKTLAPAMAALSQAVDRVCGAEIRKVLAESAVRERLVRICGKCATEAGAGADRCPRCGTAISEATDLIEVGLRRRLTADFVAGMIAVQETAILERIVARRDVESLAAVADFAAMAEAMSQAPAQRPGAAPEFDLKVEYGGLTLGTIDGSEPVPLRCHVNARGRAWTDLGSPDMVLEMVLGKFKPETEDAIEKGRETGFVVIEGDVTIRLVEKSGGAVKASATTKLSVRVPVKTKKGLKTHREFYPDGKTLRREYTYMVKSGDWIQEGADTNYHKDGSKARVRHFKADVLHGPYQEWYTNGNLMAQGAYVDGRPDGPWISKFENGGPEKEYTVRNGLKEGQYTEWRANGKMLERGPCRAGTKDGEWEHFHAGGVRAARGSYAKDVRVGVWSTWWENGSRKDTGNYKDGVPDGAWTYYLTGGGRKEGTLAGGREVPGTWTEYDAADKVVRKW